MWLKHRFLMRAIAERAYLSIGRNDTDSAFVLLKAGFSLGSREMDFPFNDQWSVGGDFDGVLG